MTAPALEIRELPIRAIRAAPYNPRKALKEIDQS